MLSNGQRSIPVKRYIVTVKLAFGLLYLLEYAPTPPGTLQMIICNIDGIEVTMSLTFDFDQADVVLDFLVVNHFDRQVHNNSNIIFYCPSF